jgi:hypothetical protein
MTQEAPICKFCLDTSETRKNPLIEPCDCRGSMQFVHEQCLSRWRRLNPARNADICLLCFHPYRLAIGEILEHLPDESSLVIFLLRFPFLLCFTVNYLGAIQYSFLYKHNMYMVFEYYQYIFQAIFFLFFATIWKVKNKRLYWKAWNTRTAYMMLFFHLVCNYYIHAHELWAIVPLNWTMCYYYRKHRSVLHTLNNL